MSLLSSGIFADLLNFFCWLVLLQNAAPETSLFGGIVVRVLTFAASYGLVGIIFKSLHCLDKGWMSIVYFVISTLFGFVLAYVVWKIEQHILIIGIVFGVVAISTIVFLIVSAILSKRSNSAEE